MVGVVAKVVEATFCVGEETAGGSAHAVAIGALDDAGCGKEGRSSNGIVFRTGPETEDNEIRMMILPPEWGADVLLRNPKNRIILNA